VRHPNGIQGNVPYTRYQHSIGVAKLANLHSQEKGLSSVERAHSIVAALLHDVGHGPLSHSLEPLFAEHFGLNHHLATAAIILGRVRLGKELLDILRKHKIDAERVLDILNGGQKDRYDGFFSGPINFDTIEAILRSQTYLNRHRRLPTPETVTYAAIHRSSDLDRRLVDAFWNYKGEVYRYLINSQMGVLADAFSQYCMQKKIDSFALQDYYLT
jgi:uncharacterized protein